MSDEPIFIVGAHKSGSSFLRSLLDGHSELTVIPIEAHYFKHANYWIDYSFRRQQPSESLSFTESAVTSLEKHLKEHNPYSDSNAHELGINLQDFQQELEAGLHKASNEKQRFEAYMAAILHAYGAPSAQKKGTLRICEKSVENAEFVGDLQRLYPKAKFLHIIRNPYENLASFRRYRQKVENRYPRVDRMVLSLKNNYYHLYKNQRNCPNYHVVRYEDLATETSKTMHEIADFLKISFEDALLSPTADGQPWSGNTTKTSHTESDITDLEKRYVNKAFGAILRDYGYQQQLPAKSFWRRNKNESTKRYILNRALYYSL